MAESPSALSTYIARVVFVGGGLGASPPHAPNRERTNQRLVPTNGTDALRTAHATPGRAEARPSEPEKIQPT
jgi:hypothetical protein